MKISRFSKILVLLITVALFLAACGGTGSSPQSSAPAEEAPQQSQQGTNQEETTQDETTQEETSQTDGDATQDTAAKEVKVGIAQLVEHPSLDATREGFLDALRDHGFVEGENLVVDYNNAQNDPPTNLTIAQKMASEDLDLVLAIATPTAIAIAQHVTDKPVLFAAITDPLDARLVDNLEKPGGNITGAADMNPEATVKLMQFIAEEVPNVNTVGVVINEGEPNAVVTIDLAEEVLSDYDISVVRAAVSNTSEVKQAAESLIGRADAIFVALDNTVINGVDAIIQVAEEHKIPFFSSDRDTVEAGAIATYGFKYYDHGYQAGEMAVEILNGADPGEMSVTFPDKLDLIINVEAANKQGLEVTQSMKDKVIDKENILNE